MNTIKPLQDTDVCPFGKYHKEGRKMEKVPVSWLHWAYHNTDDAQIIEYCNRSMRALVRENPDLIWEEKATPDCFEKPTPHTAPTHSGTVYVN